MRRTLSSPGLSALFRPAGDVSRWLRWRHSLYSCGVLRRLWLALALFAGCDGPPTLVRVHYPAGTRSIALRGSQEPLSPAVGLPMNAGADDTWSLSLRGLSGPLEVRPYLDDTTPSRGASYFVTPGQTLDIYPHFTVTKGEVSKRWTFFSNILGNTRPIWVYLPPTYLENPRARFPVLYMHDGQNLFDPSTAYGGNPWWVQNTLDAAAESGDFAEAIVIGPENNADRTNEYTPVVGKEFYGGHGAAYLRMLVEELKPKVDAELRTLPQREKTAVMGSSLGGLISSYAGITHADSFGLVGIMSPSTWWADNVILTLVPSTPAAPRPLRVYVDSGDSGVDNDDVTATARLAEVYRALGYKDGVDFKYVVQQGAIHNETYWAQRLPEALKFLLGPR
jgi:predicted alpha/beta superfamily hydrolase